MKQIEWKYVIATLVALVIWFYVSPMLTTTTTENGGNGGTNGGSGPGS